MTPIIKSSKIIQTKTNTIREGMEIIAAIIVPLKIISLIDNLILSLDNSWIFENGNKNQRYFIFRRH